MLRQLSPSLVTVEATRSPEADEDAVDAEIVRQQLVLARQQFHTVINAESQLREDMAEDLRFVASEQWDEDTITEREQDDRPAMTFNRLPQFVRMTVNQMRIARQAIEVIPRGNGASKDTADVFQGIIRQIQDESDAMRAYITAAEAQARIGRGYWRVVTEWDQGDPLGFRQVLRIKRVRNPFLVYMDPTIQEIDGSDARFCFIVQDMPKDLYREKYGNASMASLEAFRASEETDWQDWMPEGKVRIAEWWRVDLEMDELYLLRWPNGTGQIVQKSVFNTWPAETRGECSIVKQRPLETRVVKSGLINAVEFLEGNADLTDGEIQPGSRIPIFPVIGEEIDLNGRMDYRGMVRDAKDPQRMYNYETNALAEILALAPKAPYIGFVGQFEGLEAKWNQANRRNFGYLEVNPVTIAGTAAPFPQRTIIDPGVGAIVQAISRSDNDLQNTMAMYNPSLGRGQSGQQSGKAIAALQQQGEIANSNFQDNHIATLRSTGRYLVEVIPHYYDIPTVLRIIGTDEKPREVMVHAGNLPDKFDEEEQKQATGVEGIYDLSVGKYDVTVSVGPSTATKRQEAIDGLTQILQAQPEMWKVLGDLVVENMDWNGATAAAKRLKQLLPPEMQDDGGPAKDLPPQAQAQLAQQAQAIQMLQQKMQELADALKKAEEIIKEKQIEREMSRFEWTTRKEIAQIEAGRKSEETNTKARTDLAKAQIDASVTAQEGQQDRVNEHALAEREHRHRVVEGALDRRKE